MNYPRYSVNEINSSIVVKLQCQINDLKKRIEELERGIDKNIDQCTCGNIVETDDWICFKDGQIIECPKCLGGVQKNNVTYGISLFNPTATLTYDGHKCIVKSIRVVKDKEPVTTIYVDGVITNELI